MGKYDFWLNALRKDSTEYDKKFLCLKIIVDSTVL